ncbi:unnamed protein product [Bursaphelenchus okinawaensis]|uniref:Galactosylgalactosylxylosylprotein 3-beta-glucuronosyltransferase n=1 Tax=Bursaphelenchus okinawaensis TaxID=465554 RepID=A0A811L8H1_9BILA|nr:unnamed protein product [Bursaphelenchus okinawaensis]CAG9118264.1 unnamed protein product [Bursaphelenchus okinawaensis]
MWFVKPQFDFGSYININKYTNYHGFAIARHYLKYIALFLIGLYIGNKNTEKQYIFVNNGLEHPPERGSMDYPDNRIIVITPTYQHPERLGDITMLSQTLMHVKRIHWVVIEDANQTLPVIDQFLKRTGISYTYLHTTNKGLPCRGWAQRNLALEYLRQNRYAFGKNDVIYFADDDNAYDFRIFDEYIRKVTTMGVWAVGTSGSTFVESPRVEDGKVVGFHVMFRPERKYATDMAGFAINIDVLLNSR